MKIGFYTLGCKLNQAEAEEVKDKLIANGFNIAVNPHQAGAVILAACAVTAGASQRTRQMIRAFKKRGAKIFVIGCLEEKIPEVDFYFKNLNKVIYKLRNINDELVPQIDDRQKETPNKISSNIINNNRVRAFIKIQTGCNFKCAYCITRRFRGRSQSIDPQKIIKQIKQKMKHGAKEIVLTGINIGLYRLDIGGLTELFKKILKETEVRRLRFGSIDPRLINNEFIKLFHNKRLCPHLHLSIQSGSDKILRAMQRNYTAADCLKIINRFRRLNPFFSFSADIIVGFPGETEKDFLSTCDFVKKAKLVKTHIFPFSARSGTEAANLPSQISSLIKKERLNALQQVAAQSRLQYLKLLSNKKRPVLFEGKRHRLWEGYTPEFVRVGIKSKENLKGKIKSITILPNFVRTLS